MNKKPWSWYIEARPDKIVFTGSVFTGRHVAEACAPLLIPTVLELGGKDPMIVLDDANLEIATSGVLWGAFMNAGQTCLSVERCYVHESIYQKFLEKCVEKTGNLRIGSNRTWYSSLSSTTGHGKTRRSARMHALARDADAANSADNAAVDVSKRS